MKCKHVRLNTHNPTIYNIHNDNFNSFVKNRNNIDFKKKQLHELNTQLYEYKKDIYTNIKQITSIKDQISKICNDINDIENNKTEMHYYALVSNILIDYFDGSILPNTTSDDTVLGNITSIQTQCINKATLLNEYNNILQNKNNIYASLIYSTYCNCIDGTALHDLTTGYIICNKCGNSTRIFMDADVLNYKDNIQEKPNYPYKRINHFNEWVTQLQAKESIDIPQEVYKNILNELKKNRIYDIKNLTIERVKKLLKTLKYNQYYEHIPHIISNINGIPPPRISRDDETKLKDMFRQIQVPFEKHKPCNRINFLSYSYVLNKMCRLIGLHTESSWFTLLKSREKLRNQDIIWKKICNELDWEFYPSI
jgi:hypothetical protein